jgi:tetratricopeptide (TPR) repeat protein
MTMSRERGLATAFFMLVLWTTAGSAATGPQTELNNSLDPAAIFSRIMKANAEKAAATEHPLATDVTRKLWRSRVSSPEQADDAQAQIALNEMVRRVRSVKFDGKEQEPHAAPAFVMPEPVDNRLDAPPAGDNTVKQAVQPTAMASATPEGPLPREAAEALKRVLADPNQAGEPLELAELLYLTGRRQEAAVFYRKSLDLVTGKEPAAREDRAWILLQLGNCLRETDPAKAKDVYAKLIAEHPDSPWVELAKAHSQLIAWYEQVQPRQWVVSQETPSARQVAASQKSQP